MRRFIDWGPALVVLTATVVALLVAPSMVRRVEFAQTSARVSLARQALGEDDILERLDQAIRRVAESVEPSVAHIEVSVGPHRFASSSGSGWVYDAAGHVVTNAHVLKGESTIRVQLSDGRLYEAAMVGADPLTDIAVVRLPEVRDIVPAARATGQQPRQGERVFAFGSPFGFKFSMSEGIISGLGREPTGAVATSSGYTNFIQTDAAVNPGNSGGPLVNVRGEVVGMNVAIATGSESDGTTVEGQSAGISFAIPLPVIESVVEQLIETGKVRHGYLGINLPGSVEDAYAVGYNGFGVVVAGVRDGEPADQAGVRVNDVITALNGQRATGVGVLRSLISSLKPGDVAELAVWRDGERLSIPVTLGEATEEVAVGPGLLTDLIRHGVYFLQNDRRAIPWDDPPVVLWVDRGSAADREGFARGQRVIRVAGREVATLREMTTALADADLLIGREVAVVLTTRDMDTNESNELAVSLRLSR